MRTPKCCICGNKRENAFLHFFPVSDEKRLNQWLVCVNLESLKVLPKGILSTRSVCHVHFERWFIKPNSRLKYGAYPTLFTPDEITSGVPAQQYPDSSLEYQNSRKRHLDHSYFKSDPPVKVPRLTGTIECQHMERIEYHLVSISNHFSLIVGGGTSALYVMYKSVLEAILQNKS